MKRNRQLLATVLALICLLAISPAASAVEPAEGEIQPRFTGISKLAANLTISTSGYASCYGSVRPNPDHSVDLTVELQQDGTTIKSWTASGSGDATFSIDKGYYVTEGHNYQVIVTAVVKNSSGSVIATESMSSVVRSY